MWRRLWILCRMLVRIAPFGWWKKPKGFCLGFRWMDGWFLFNDSVFFLMPSSSSVCFFGADLMNGRTEREKTCQTATSCFKFHLKCVLTVMRYYDIFLYTIFSGIIFMITCLAHTIWYDITYMYINISISWSNFSNCCCCDFFSVLLFFFTIIWV